MRLEIETPPLTLHKTRAHERVCLQPKLDKPRTAPTYMAKRAVVLDPGEKKVCAFPVLGAGLQPRVLIRRSRRHLKRTKNKTDLHSHAADSHASEREGPRAIGEREGQVGDPPAKARC